MSDYNRRTWLNPITSTSTGSVVCCHVPESQSRRFPTFIEIADCSGKISLHPADGESLADFVKKLKILRDEIDMFITALEIDQKQADLLKMQRNQQREDD